MATIPTSLVPCRDNDVLLISTSSGYWGKGKTIHDAKRALTAAGQGRNAPKGWRVRSAHPDTYVDEDGSINYPKNHPPMVIAQFDLPGA